MRARAAQGILSGIPRLSLPMHTLLRSFQSTAHAIARLIAAPQADEFTCGECARNAQCGLPPSGNCGYRLPRPERDQLRAQWPISSRLL